MTRVVLAIGRWMPIHKGHKSFLVKLARSFDKLIIGIGSCYENGTPRNCIPAIEREKLLRCALRAEGIEDSRIAIVPVEDRETFEEWIDDVLALCRIHGVTHFCTGNKEDILDVLSEKGIKLDLEMINPEEGSDFPYHATDIRNAILNGETDDLDAMIPAEIKEAVLIQCAREIKAANEGRGKRFIPGRQTVDTVLFVRSRSGRVSFLCGDRDGSKRDFPHDTAIPGGGILPFESPINAALRTLKDESGISAELVDNSTEPARIRLFDREEDMHFISIYASEDERVNGTRGGGSQCFAVIIDAEPSDLQPALCSSHDLVNLRFADVRELKDMTLAYEQKRMVYEAAERLSIDVGEEYLAVYAKDGKPTGDKVRRSIAHSDGILHGAAHVFIYRTWDGITQILLQKRSPNKDSFAGCLDISSAGHVEYGMDHDTTALKELHEELGIRAEHTQLKKLFVKSCSVESVFHGKRFINNEIYATYLLCYDGEIDPSALQKEEVSEVIWLDIDLIIGAVKNGDPSLCLDLEEFEAVANELKKL